MRRVGVAGLALVIMVGAAACGSSSNTASSTTTSTTTASTTSRPTASCSASALGASLPADPSLPAAVASMRADIARAAVACDYDTLASLVDRNGKAIRYTFGEGNDPVGYWRDQEGAHASVPPLRAMRLLLALPSAEQHAPDGSATYVWPAAFANEHPTSAELEDIAATGLYDMKTLNSWVASGTNYLGYRIFITAGGDWTLFVEGD